MFVLFGLKIMVFFELVCDELFGDVFDVLLCV